MPRTDHSTLLSSSHLISNEEATALTTSHPDWGSIPPPWWCNHKRISMASLQVGLSSQPREPVQPWVTHWSPLFSILVSSYFPYHTIPGFHLRKTQVYHSLSQPPPLFAPVPTLQMASKPVLIQVPVTMRRSGDINVNCCPWCTNFPSVIRIESLVVTVLSDTSSCLGRFQATSLELPSTVTASFLNL